MRERAELPLSYNNYQAKMDDLLYCTVRFYVNFDRLIQFKVDVF